MPAATAATSMTLLTPIALGAATAPNRVMLGPHVTNLGDDERRLTDRHVEYYRRRAAGGTGVIVVEGASVHASDWPYERAPLAERCGAGWEAIVAACRPHGALVIAALDHAGGQGSSAYSQAPLWAPSRVPEVNTREVPKAMEPADIEAVVQGFAAAARHALEAGCDGVEINLGQHSLLRQFLSGLTNHRGDAWGTDRMLLAREVLGAVRAAAGVAVLGVRFSADELAPWAGITPEMAPDLAGALVDAPTSAGRGVDYLAVVRGSIFSAHATRPDFHEPPMFNLETTRAVRTALDGRCPVVLQGSVVDVHAAEAALADRAADLVEMTRAQIADPDLVAKVRAGEPERIRPCTRCNQACQVRDARNPIVSCVGEPSSGHEHADPDWYRPTQRPRNVTVVGAGVAGLECARVAATIGHRVTVLERSAAPGGLAAAAGPNGDLVRWLIAECTRLGVTIETGTTHATTDDVVVQATGSRAGPLPYDVEPDGVPVYDVAEVRLGRAALPETGTVVVVDPIGGPIAVALAEELGERAVLVTQDQIAGNELARTGDLAPANTRLAQRGVRLERRSLPRLVTGRGLEVEDRFSGERRHLDAAAVVDCGFRLPTDPLAVRADGSPAVLQAGDCVAPRTVLEAVLEGRRAALAIDSGP